MKKNISLLIALLLSVCGYSQVTELSGRIADSLTGRALTGASISNLHSRRTVMANEWGQFKIRAATDDTLVITRIGYQKTQYWVNGGNTGPLTILFKSVDANLQDVVVNTGYQSIPKERATGSFVQVDNQLINKRPQAFFTTVVNRSADNYLFNLYLIKFQ